MTTTFAYTAAGQIASTTRSNDAYAWTGAATGAKGYTANGLNQYTAAGGASPGYDARGNLTGWGSAGYAYTSENLLKSSSAGAALAYNPLGQMLQTASSGVITGRFGYDGSDLIADYDDSNVLQRRYVFGAGTDEPLVWYEGSGTSDRRFLVADERGSIVAVTNSSGAATAINTYDEYGVPGSGNTGRFQYTGQAWIPELGLYYYKARMYWPQGGRFMQTDPIGYGNGLNWYNYVGGDPVNWRDPSGLKMVWACSGVADVMNCGWTDDGNGRGLTSGDFRTVSSPGLNAPDDPGAAEGGQDIVVTGSVCRSCHQSPPPVPASPGPQIKLPSLSMYVYSIIKVINCSVFYQCLPTITPNSTPESAGDKRRKSAPKNAPRGTRPINEKGWPRDKIHDIKDGIGAAPDDWVGIDPNGNVITTDPETGDSVDHGPASGF